LSEFSHLVFCSDDEFYKPKKTFFFTALRTKTISDIPLLALIPSPLYGIVWLKYSNVVRDSMTGDADI
jgi:hypothetical protein